MMSQSFAGADFWLPPEFLTDDDVVKERDTNKQGNSEFEGGYGSKSLFQYDFPSGFASNLGSPVESVVGSTETESDEEDYLAGLTRQMAHSTLSDDPMFPSDNHRRCCQSGSPQSTLLSSGIGCGCWQRSTQSCHSRVSSSVAVWDLYRAAAGEVARIRMMEESHGCKGGLLAPPRKVSHIPVAAKIPDQENGYNTVSSPSYQKLQAARFQHLKQQLMMKQRRQQLIQSRGIVDNNLSTPGLSPAAWPSLQHSHHQQKQRAGPAMRAMFLGNPAVKRECAGTGVFLPRPVNTSTTSMDTRKKPAMTAVLVPAKVVHALKLDSESCLHHESDASLRIRNSNLYGSQKRSFLPDAAIGNELRLPQEWSY